MNAEREIDNRPTVSLDKNVLTQSQAEGFNIYDSENIDKLIDGLLN